MSKVEIVKKLSVGKLIGKAFRDELTAENPRIELGRMAGIARGTKTGESQFGPWTALTGDFMFIPSTGANKDKRFRSGVCFLPDVALELVLPVLASGDIAGVEVAFAIIAVKDADSTTGYVYSAEFLTEPAANDPLTDLVAKALPAPEASTEGDAPAGDAPNGDAPTGDAGKGKGKANA